MNEFYAADPKTCTSSEDLRTLLGWFGPFTGRYLATYPYDWRQQIEANFSRLGEVERTRASILLRRAKERTALVARPNLPWASESSWLKNALPLQKPIGPAFDAIVGCDEDALHNERVIPFHNYEPPVTAEERILARATEFGRVARTLLLVSTELCLVDPYLNPLEARCARVLAELLAVAAKGTAERIIIWARASAVCDDPTTINVCVGVSEALRTLSVDSRFYGKGGQVELRLVRDEDRASKMHGRYLLSIKGGIRFDQGFAELPKGRRMDVAPIGRHTHDELVGIYLEGRNDMGVVRTFRV